MSEKRLKFGDIVKVDWPNIAYATPPAEPDERRWMVVSFDDRLKWTLIFIGPSEKPAPVISHWDSLTGFVRVEA